MASETDLHPGDTDFVLVLNSGSSSIKFQVLDPTNDATDDPFISALVERIGEEEGHIKVKINGTVEEDSRPIADHSVGLQRAFDLMSKHNVGPLDLNLLAVGHRVVHGGDLFSQPVLIDEKVIDQIESLIPLAPLHNPANLEGIKDARKLLSNIPHVAVFDTGFFATLPEDAANYAIDLEVAKKYDLRRYGFHGTSHEFISQAVPSLLGKDAKDVNQIVLHLGNGASVSAVRGGNAVDTSMGLTPLEGLVMGTRSGDIDPGIIFHLERTAGMNVDEIDHLLNRQSGLKGVAGVNDFRELDKLVEEGDKNAKLAYDIYLHRLRKYIGAYMAVLGRTDAISFTAGVGENAVNVRRDVLAGLEGFGIKIDADRNENKDGVDGPREITTDDSTTKVFVIPTNEELAIARYAMEIRSQQ